MQRTSSESTTATNALPTSNTFPQHNRANSPHNGRSPSGGWTYWAHSLQQSVDESFSSLPSTTSPNELKLSHWHTSPNTKPRTSSGNQSSIGMGYLIPSLPTTVTNSTTGPSKTSASTYTYTTGLVHFGRPPLDQRGSGGHQSDHPSGTPYST